MSLINYSFFYFLSFMGLHMFYRCTYTHEINDHPFHFSGQHFQFRLLFFSWSDRQFLMKKRKELCHILLCHFITHLTALLSWLYSTNIYACRNFIIIISAFFLFKEKCWCCRVSVLFISCSFVRLNAIFIEITKSRSWCCRWWVACNKSLTFFYFFFLFFFLTL